MKYRVELPYPSVAEIQRNPEIAKLIMHAYAGEVSEDTAIHQYLFQSVILQEKNPEVSKILEQISEVEMRHFRLLAEMIRNLGVYPIYLDPNFHTYNYFTSRYVSYEVDFKCLLKADIEAEQNAILNYESLIAVISDEAVCNVLRRIILDETLHLEIFEKLYASCS
ncbi:MAG: hypothetical protein HFH86_01995 [Bacilli bacterium]|jgi:bacterioferritin|nr:hypothetical protein [Bacilli bacterium]